MRTENNVVDNVDIGKMKDDEIKKLKEENDKLKRELRDQEPKKSDYKVTINLIMFVSFEYSKFRKNTKT